MATISSIQLPIVETNHKPIAAIVMALIVATFAAIIIKLTMNAGIPAPVVAVGRLVLASITLTPFVLTRYRHELKQMHRTDIILIAGAGFWLVMHFVLMVYALQQTSVLIVQVITNTAPIWVAVLEVTFLKERLNRYVWAGLIVAIIGGTIIALAGLGQIQLEGDLFFGAMLSLVSAVASAIYMTMSRRGRKHVSIMPFVWVLFTSASIIGIIFLAITQTPIIGYPAEGYFWLVLLTIFPQLIGHSGFNYALGFFSATMVSLSGQIISVTAPIAAFLIFAEVPGWIEIIGSIVILVGVVIAINAKSRPSST